MLEFSEVVTLCTVCVCTHCMHRYVCAYLCQNADELREVAEQLTDQIQLSTGRTPVSFLEFDATDPTSSHYDSSTMSSFILPSSVSMTTGSG